MSDSFDFDAPPERRPAAREQPEVWSVGELTRHILELVAGLGRVAVEGEVSRVSRAASGHVYFDLKDLDAKLACKLWRSQVARALKGELREGDRVIAHGKLDVYLPQGSYSLIVDRIEAAGLGALLVKLEELKALLRARGWFDRHRALPPMPRTIGVATSRDGAALQDFLRTRTQRWPLYPVRLAHTPVQGPGAAEQIARAIARLDASGVDVIVVCRGGGSLEDLWAFNELPVAEAIWKASVPVVCGVGHETDVTLADLVADVRAHTPTDAAQRTIPDRGALCAALERVAGYLAQAIDGLLSERAARLERASGTRLLRDPSWMHVDRAQSLVRLGRALRLAAQRCLDESRARLWGLHQCVERRSPRQLIEARASRLERAGLSARSLSSARLVGAEQRLIQLAGKLEALSPLSILERGYSITFRRGSAAPLSDARGLSPGDELETRLARQLLISRFSAAQDAQVPRRPG